MAQPIRRSAIVLPFLVLAWLAGCSRSSTEGTVNGTVTLDDQPLQQGVVRFVPVDAQARTASAPVRDGKFTATVPIGEMRVEFSAPKIIGRHKVYDTPDSPVVDEVAERIPERFNVKSELRITVKRGSQNEIFSLKSK